MKKLTERKRGISLGGASRKCLVKTDRGWSLLVGDSEDGARQMPGLNGKMELEWGADQAPFLSL